MTDYEKNAARSRELWAGLSDKEKRFGKKFGLAVFAAFAFIALLEGQMGPLF